MPAVCAHLAMHRVEPSTCKTDTSAILLPFSKKLLAGSASADTLLVQTAAALSEAAIKVPDIYDTLASAFVQAVLGQFTLDTAASINTATTALGAMRLAQQPYIVQVTDAAQYDLCFVACNVCCSALHIQQSRIAARFCWQHFVTLLLT